MNTEPITPERLAGIKWRATHGILVGGVQDRADLLAEVTRLRAALADRDAKITAALEHDHADGCQSVLSPTADWPCNCWRAVFTCDHKTGKGVGGFVCLRCGRALGEEPKP